MDRFTGSCLCGNVRIEASGAAYRVGISTDRGSETCMARPSPRAPPRTCRRFGPWQCRKCSLSGPPIAPAAGQGGVDGVPVPALLI